MGTWAAVTLGLAVAAAVQGQASMPRLLPDLEAFSGGAAQVDGIGQGGSGGARAQECLAARRLYSPCMALIGSTASAAMTVY